MKSPIPQRRFGKTGLDLTILTFGAMQLPDIPEEDAIATVHRAMALGINHYETARGYGNSEEILGRALKGFNRSTFYITTKITPKHYRNYRECIEESLKRLQVDYIDNFDIHGINREEHFYWTFKKGGVMDTVRKAMSEGLIRHVGFSTHGPLELILKCIETREFESVNLHYYYFNQRNYPAIKRAGELNMGVLIISPTDKGGQLHKAPEFLKKLTAPYHPIVINHRFCLSHPEITTVTVGAAHPEEFNIHMEAIKTHGPLTKEEEAIMERLDRQYEKLGKTLCTFCHECLPCPQGINIPEVLRLRNLSVAFQMIEYGKYRYNMFGKGDHWFWGNKATLCNDCGECLPRCPEGLNIPALLRETHSILDDKEGKRRWNH